MVVSCWHANPKSRPPFSDILNSLKSLLQHVKENEKGSLCTGVIFSKSVPPSANSTKKSAFGDTCINSFEKTKGLNGVHNHKSGPVNVPLLQNISTVYMFLFPRIFQVMMFLSLLTY